MFGNFKNILTKIKVFSQSNVLAQIINSFQSCSRRTRSYIFLVAFLNRFWTLLLDAVTKITGNLTS